MRRLLFAAVLVLCVQSVAADEVSLRLGGKEVQLEPVLREPLAALGREVLRRCGPNTSQHPGNFGLAAIGVEQRWKLVIEGSRLRVVFAERPGS
jgi:hypothetical protein